MNEPIGRRLFAQRLATTAAGFALFRPSWASAAQPPRRTEGVTSELDGHTLRLVHRLSRSARGKLGMHPLQATAIVLVVAASQRPRLVFPARAGSLSLPAPAREGAFTRWEARIDLAKHFELVKGCDYFVHASFLQYQSAVHFLRFAG
jgi:hypothetical protein